MLMRTSREEIDRDVAEYRAKKQWHFEYAVADAGGYSAESVFIITLGRDGKKFKHTYRKGWGHRRWRTRRAPLGYMRGDYWKQYQYPGQLIDIVRLPRLKSPKECEADLNHKHQQEVFDDFAAMTEPIPPTLEEVLGSLMSDAELVRHGQSFTDFCIDTGMTGDEALEIYNDYRNVWGHLVRLGAYHDVDD